MAFGVTIAIAIALLLVVLMLKGNLTDSFVAGEQRYKISHMAKLAKENSIELTTLARQYVATLDDKYKNQYDLLVDQIQGKAAYPDGITRAYLNRLRDEGVDKNALVHLEESVSLSMNLVNTEVAAFNLVADFTHKDISDLTAQERQQWLQAMDMLNNPAYMRETTKIMAPVDKFVKASEGASQLALQRVQASADTISLFSIVAVLVIIALLILCYLWLEKNVIRVTQLLTAKAQKIAQGDLTQHIQLKGENELAQLAYAFNLMVSNLSDLLKTIQSQSEIAKNAASKLSDIAKQSAELTTKQDSAIEVISSSIYENSTAVKEVAGNCSEAAQSATRADDVTCGGLQIVEKSIQSVRLVSDALNQATHDLVDLETSVKDVAAILDVINNIAEQTNLLALNAAIEAARAGEQGRGFAVVADEVRTLAKRTQESTTEIQRKIGALQSVTNAVSEQIQTSDSHAKQAVDNSQQVGEILREIQQLVTNINQMNTSIAAASEEQTQVSDDIAERLVVIHDGSKIANGQSRSVSESSAQLTKIANLLAQETKRFKLNH